MRSLTWRRRALAATLLLSVVVPVMSAGAAVPGRANMQAPGSAIALSDFAAVDAFMEREMLATGVPGAAVAIVRGDQIAYARGFGMADSAGRMVTAQTPFILGSLSKSFTALAVMQLVDAGRIALDEPVTAYIPWFTIDDQGGSGAITVRQLLNQTSGLSRRDGDATEQFGHGPDALERNVRAIADVRATSPAGSRFEYSNANYQVLGLIVETVGGQPYGDYIGDHVFRPLDMSHSFGARAAAQAAGLAQGHRGSLFGGAVAATDQPFLPGALPSGYLISSAEDLGRYLAAHLNDGRYRDRTIVSPASMAALHGIPAFPRTTYAMGWEATRLFGRAALVHTGLVADFSSSAVLLPEDGYGVVVLANLQSLWASNRILAMGTGVAASLLGVDPAAVPEAGTARTAIAVVGFMVAWEVVSVWLGLRLVRRRTRPARLPRRTAVAMAAMASLDLALIAVAVWLMPVATESSLQVMVMYQPDLIIPMLGTGAFSLAWGLVRSVLLLARPVSWGGAFGPKDPHPVDLLPSPNPGARPHD